MYEINSNIRFVVRKYFILFYFLGVGGSSQIWMNLFFLGRCVLFGEGGVHLRLELSYMWVNTVIFNTRLL